MSSSPPPKRRPGFAPYGARPSRQRHTGKNQSRFPPLIQSRHPIRLLELHDSYVRPGCAVDICCSLKSYDLRYCPPYRALSYTWGSPFPEDDDPSGVKDWSSPTRPIFLNGRYIYVRQNLYDGLHELVRRGWTGFYWIDFMCIDQHDLSERTDQVASMGEIFSGAFEVVCWLGRADSHLENVMELHHRLQTASDNIGFKVVAALAPTTFDQIFCAHTRGPQVFSNSFRPIETLCSSYVVFERRRWFGRLWVAQEVALARRLVALCGERLLEWRTMRKVAYHAFHSSKSISWGVYYKSSNKAGHIPGQGILDMSQLRDDQYDRIPNTAFLGTMRKTPEQEKYAIFLETLEGTRNLQASDPRDKIYGILGIVSRVQAYIPGPHLAVDYTAPVVKLYTQIATAMVKGLPYLSILGGQPCPSSSLKRQGLPSWVPDFNAPASLQPRIGKTGHCAGVEPGSYPAREVQGNQLILTGHLLDTISKIWHTSTTVDHTWYVADILGLCSSKTVPQLQPDPIVSYFKILSRCDSPRCQHLTMHEAAQFRAHVLTTLAECARRSDQDQINLMKLSLERLRQKSLASNSVPTSEEVDTWSDLGLLNEIDVVDTNKTQQLAHDFIERVIFFSLASTESDLIVGTNVSCQAGDQVWIVRDAQAPLILRPVPDSTDFTLVGEAFVDGVMFGEVFDAEDCPEPVRITIV